MSLLSIPNLAGLVRDTLRAPRPTFARLMALKIDRVTLWQTLLLVVVLSIFVGEVSNLVLVAMLPADGARPLLLTPLTLGLIQMAILVVSVFLIDWIGRSFGGKGRFPDAILAVAWVQFIMMCLQILQFVAMLLVPPLAGLILLAGMVLFFWLLTNFIAELHGFDNLGKVFGMIVMVLIGVALGLSFLLTLVGVTVPR
ncbi:YIP1 family protein [Maribius pontilimi]|uniref:YIP1 family protein n=1 Tax=Palleronia pontilimi TaxID=1964209 RepID=A0A934I9Q4_9RHOB|nr:Yip1 family protein [Palleronia pontilimi]MBJ3763013.1 YIP1 family protein [Palleronia pontilimi]